MIHWLKSKIYFLVAGYFKIFAKIQLSKWRPKIVVLTGSNGKTTLLHLLEAQIGERAKYSHHANSSFGIPFDILGLRRKTFAPLEWVYLFLAAPIKAFTKKHKHKLYIVEADCDRPGEGKFLAGLLKPEVVIWLSSARTHSMNFSSSKNIDEAIAHEFGYFVQSAKNLNIINADESRIVNQLKRSSANAIKISAHRVESNYKIFGNSTEFTINNQTYTFFCLLPSEVYYAVAATIELLKFFNLSIDASFKKFHLPPGRSSVFAGIKNTTLIDSSYNANLQSMQAMINLFEAYPAPVKWAVLGDFLEQGTLEREEHERLAELIAAAHFDKVILMGHRVVKYTFPKLKKLSEDSSVEKFEMPKEALNFLRQNLRGGEAILFKGARFMEGIVENLLAHQADANKLCRREKIWQHRRKEWGL